VDKNHSTDVWKVVFFLLSVFTQKDALQKKLLK